MVKKRNIFNDFRKFFIAGVVILLVVLLSMTSASAADMRVTGGDLVWTSSGEVPTSGYTYETYGYNFAIYKNNTYAGSCDVYKGDFSYDENVSDGTEYTDYRMSLDVLAGKIGQNLHEGNIYMFADPIVRVYANGSVYRDNLRSINEVGNAFQDMCGVWYTNNSDDYGLFVNWACYYLEVKPGTGVTSTYGSGWYDWGTDVNYGGTASTGYHGAGSGTTNVTNSGSITVNAISNTYYVAYNGNGGGGTMAGQQVNYDQTFNLRGNGFSRPGYEFTGWNTNPWGTGNWYSADQSVRNLTAENGQTITLYAQWKASYVDYKVVHKYQNIDGSYGSSLDVTQIFQALSESTVTPGTIGQTGFTSPGTQTVWVSPNGDTVVTYYYTRNKYTIAVGLKNSSGLKYSDYGTFDVYINGTLVGDNIRSYTASVPYGSSYSITDVKAKIGHTFDGITGTYMTQSGQVLGTTTLYANFHLNRYTIHFDLVGGVDGPPDVTLYYNQEYNQTIVPTRTGHTFTGWNTREDGTGDVYPAMGNIKNVTAQDNVTVTLYARWSEKTFTTIKIANSWHGGTFVRRTPGDEEWYNTAGKLCVNEKLPESYIIQEWIICADGTVEQVK